ncbi:MAG TPA: hypothetical protein VF457_19385 [Burkholderiaceae bacterium]
MDDDEYEFGVPLEADETAIVDALTPKDITAIDDALLGATSSNWSKVAMVLARQMKRRPDVPDDVPLEFYWSRLCNLVARGDLESQGNLRRPMFSEVRRASII